MTHWLERSYQETVGYDLLERLVDVGDRLGGSENERRAAELTRDALSDVGTREAGLSTFELTGWERGTSEIVHEESNTPESVFALPRSPTETVTGPLVDLGYGLPDEFAEAELEGAIVMVSSEVPSHHPRFVHRREKYDMAIENEAVGFVYRNHLNGCLPRSGSISGQNGSIGEIPAVGLSKEAGLRLVRRSGDDPITLSVNAEITDTTSQNIHAELGPNTDDRILVTAHVDGHDVSESAADNGGGVATIVEIARTLAEREDEIETRIEFVVYGAEELGLLGSAYHARETNIETVKAVLNHDVLGLSRDLRFVTNGFESFETLATRACRQLNQPVELDPRLSLSTDHWRFVEHGVPSVYVANKFGEQGRGLILTPEDTLDKIDPRNIRSHGILLSEIAINMASEGFQPTRKSADEISAALEEQNQTFKAEQYRKSAQYL